MNDRAITPSLARLIVLLTIPVLAYFSCMAAQKAVEVYKLHQRADQLRAEVADLKTQHDELQNQIDYYKSDEYVEKVAREELNLVKPGDVPVVVVSRATPEAAPQTVATKTDGASKPHWQEWLDLFTGH